MKIRILLVLFVLTAVTPSFAHGPIRRIVRGTVVGAARVVGGAGHVVGAGAIGAARVVGGVVRHTVHGVGHVLGHPFRPHCHGGPGHYYCR